jgi:glycerol-3-phosphate dehydrogenase
MAEDTVNHAITLGRLADSPCVTQSLHIHGYLENAERLSSLSVYGTDAEKIRVIARESDELAKQLHPDLPYIAAEVVWAAREEMARTVEDVLARRTRALFLNARAAIAMAPKVASILARELGKDQAWAEDEVKRFNELAMQYTLQKIATTEGTAYNEKG